VASGGLKACTKGMAVTHGKGTYDEGGGGFAIRQSDGAGGLAEDTAEVEGGRVLVTPRGNGDLPR
jgi:hypothetical protein